MAKFTIDYINQVTQAAQNIRVALDVLQNQHPYTIINYMIRHNAEVNRQLDELREAAVAYFKSPEPLKDSYDVDRNAHYSSPIAIQASVDEQHKRREELFRLLGIGSRVMTHVDEAPAEPPPPPIDEDEQLAKEMTKAVNDINF